MAEKSNIDNYTDRILEGDCMDLLAQLPAGSIDLIFADPPYNLQLQGDLWRPNHTKVDAVDDDWDQFAPDDDDPAASFRAYDAFTRAWLTQVRRVMAENSTIWASGTYHNIFRLGAIMQDLGFWMLNTVSWFKSNAMPNFRGTRLKNDVEFVIWAKKTPDSRYTFHHQMMKQFNDFSDGKQLGSVWKIPACGGNERLRLDDGSKLHSTQKPEELLRRIILASSNPGDLVLDPFSGTGTTPAMAKRLRRRYIGIEQNPDYAAASRERLAKVKPIASNHPWIVEARKKRPPRVPFKRLIEDGLLSPGQELYFDQPDSTAIILDNGHLRVNGFTGSIHKTGAWLKDAPTCNGWKHWSYLDSSGERQPIDRLRQQWRDQSPVRGSGL